MFIHKSGFVEMLMGMRREFGAMREMRTGLYTQQDESKRRIRVHSHNHTLQQHMQVLNQLCGQHKALAADSLDTKHIVRGLNRWLTLH